MSLVWILSLVGTLLAFQWGLVGLARWLGGQLSRPAIALGVLVPLLLLAPWFDDEVVLAPTGALIGQVPGTALDRPPLDPHSAELGDVAYLFYSWEIEVRRAFKDGELPFWSELLDGGSSPWVNLQAAVLSPIAWAARWVPIQHFLLFCLALKILVAIDGAYLLARLVGARPGYALLSGLSWGLSGAIAAWALFPHSAVAAWMPWLAAAAVRCLRAPRPPLAAASLLGAVVLVSGHPEGVLAAVLFVGASSLAWYRRGRRFRATTRRRFVGLAGAGLLAFGLAAPAWLPFLDAATKSLRAETRKAAVDRPADSGWFPVGRAKLVLAPLHPRAFGAPFSGEPLPSDTTDTVAWTPYAGLVAWFGALCALLAMPRRAALIGGLGLAVLLLAAGFRPFVALLDWSHWLRTPEATRLLPVTALALSVLGGLGWQALTRRRGRRVGLRLVPVLLACLVLVDLVPWARRFLPRGAPADFFPRTPLVEAIVERTRGGGRFLGQDYLAYPSIMPLYRVPEVRPNSPLAPAAQIHALASTLGFAPDERHYYGRVAVPRHPFARFLGVRVTLSNFSLPQPETSQERAGLSLLDGVAPPWRVWIDEGDVPPRWFLPRAVLIVGKEDVGSALAALEDPWTVFSSEQIPSLGVAPAGALVTARSTARGRFQIRLEGSEPRERSLLLASSEPYPGGWRARDSRGRRLRNVTVNGAFTGFVVPPGESQVEVRFVPPGFGFGCALALLAGVVVVLLEARRSRLAA